MQKFQRFVADQRWDLPHYTSMRDLIEQEFQAYAKLFVTPVSKVVKNWIIENAGGLTAKVNQTTDSTLFATGRVGDEDFYRYFTTDDPITIDLPDNDVSYVEVQIFEQTCAPDTVAVWDTTANSGEGGEVTQTVDLITDQAFRLVSNTIAFTGDADKLPLAVVTTAGGVITLITDSREILFDADPYSFGGTRTDRNISNLKEMYDAITTIIKEFKGTPEWYTQKNLDDENLPVRLYATTTPDSNLNIEAQQIQRGDGAGVSVPALDGLVPSFVVSSIDFQAQTTSGGTFAIAFPASTVGLFRRVGLTLKNDGTMNVAFSAEAASVGALADPGTLFIVGYHVGWIDLECTDVAGKFKTAGSATDIIENSVGGTSRIVIANKAETAASSKNLDVLEVTFADTPVVLTVTEELVLADATNGNIAISVPVPGGNDGKVFTIKKVDNTANTVTVTGTGLSAVMDAESTIVISSNGSVWVVVEDDRFNINLLDENFGNYIIPASSKRGAANTGFTDTASTNPRGLSLSELQVSEGIEYIQINGIRKTGGFDSNGLEEWEMVSPETDRRIRFYGRWATVVYNTTFGGPFFMSDRADDYVEVTGVFDSIGLLGVRNAASPAVVDVVLDGSDTGTDLDQSGDGELTNDFHKGYASLNIQSDASLSGFGYDIHTIKFVNKSAGSTFKVSGFALVGDGSINESAGNAFVRNRRVQLSKATGVTAPTIEAEKGSRAIRYIDPVDQTRKWAVRDVFNVSTTVAGPTTASIATVSIASTAGFVAGDVLLFSDSSSEELIQILTVDNATDLTMETVFVNAYTAGNVHLWARTKLSGVDRDALGEEALDEFFIREFGLSDASVSPPFVAIAPGYANGGATLQDGAHSLNYIQASMESLDNAVEGLFLSGGNSGNSLLFEFFGTGIDVLIGTQTAVADFMNFFIDDVPVLLSVLDKQADSSKWQQVCGGLPLGWHSVKFRKSGVNIDTDIKKFRTYQPKRPVALDNVPEGCILTDSLRLPDYLFRDGILARKISRGVVYEKITRYSNFDNAGSIGGTANWNSPTAEADRIFGQSYYCDRDDAFVERWFYGTGIEIMGVVGTNKGIWRFEIDGLAATTANFGSATFNGSNYSTATGEWDMYNGTQLINMKVSISGLTEGWHHAKLINTNAKNGASGGFLADLQGWGVICPAWHGKIIRRNELSGANNYGAGTNLDLRVLDPSNAEAAKQHRSSSFQCIQSLEGFSFGATRKPWPQMSGVIFLEKPAPVQVNFGGVLRNTSGALTLNFDIYIYVNGNQLFDKLDGALVKPAVPFSQKLSGEIQPLGGAPSLIDSMTVSRSFVVNLPAGKNHIMVTSTSAPVSLTSEGGTVSLSAIETSGGDRR